MIAGAAARKAPRVVLACVSLLLAPLAWAGEAERLREARATFKQERAYCLDGRSHQDPATCLKEAQAAYAEARRGTLDPTGAQAALQRNTVRRCNAHPARDRAACVRRLTDGKAAQGSVRGGGILRQVETPTR